MDRDHLIQLEASLRDGRLDQRKAALDELGQFSADVAIPILQRLSAEPEFLCRRLAVTGLGNYLTPLSLQVLTKLLESETDHNVLAEIANSLFEFGEVSIPLLKKMFECHSHWLTRQTVLAILMEAQQDEVLLTVIRQGLKDSTQTVKETAILALGQILKGSLYEEALTLLTELAQAPNWRDRWRAATALCLSSDPRAKKLLTELQKDSKHYVVAAALEAVV